MRRNDFCLKDDEYHLTVLGVVSRPDGKYLITRRAMDKVWAPGAWEVSGGACMAGEESYDAVKREVLEETGLDVSNADGGFVLHITERIRVKVTTISWMFTICNGFDEMMLFHRKRRPMVLC